MPIWNLGLRLKVSKQMAVSSALGRQGGDQWTEITSLQGGLGGARQSLRKEFEPNIFRMEECGK
jgi:hypothetical protein